MDKKLYDIEQDMLAIFSELEENDGEITPELEEKLQITREELQEKLVNYAKFIRGKELEIELREKEIERLSKRNSADEKTIEFLKERMRFSMNQFNQDKIETPLFKIKIAKSSFVDILDETLVPSDYMNTPVMPKASPDKTKIKKYLENLPENATSWAKISTREKVNIK